MQLYDIDGNIKVKGHGLWNKKKSPLIIKGYIFPTGSDIFMIPELKIP
jgi:hypothetical protein